MATQPEPTKKKSNPRTPSLGINFEHGENGAVVLYADNKELIIGMIPRGYALNVSAASAVGVAWKANKQSTLSAKRVKEVLDKVFAQVNAPIQVTPKTLESIMGTLKASGFLPEKATL